MAYENIEKHLLDLGIKPLGEERTPIDPEIWNEIAPENGAHTPAALRWFFQRFGGYDFAEGALYYDSKYQKDVMIGWFMDESELRSSFEAIRDQLHDAIPIANDGGDNYLAVGVGPENSGVVYFRIHDALQGENLYIVDNSIEHFLTSLHRES